MCLRQSSVIRLWLGIIKGMLETVTCHRIVVGDSQGCA